MLMKEGYKMNENNICVTTRAAYKGSTMTIEKAFITISTNKGIKHLSEHDAEVLYLDWVNNFLTIPIFAEYYGISYFSAKSLINKFRRD